MSTLDFLLNSGCVIVSEHIVEFALSKTSSSGVVTQSIAISADDSVNNVFVVDVQSSRTDCDTFSFLRYSGVPTVSMSENKEEVVCTCDLFANSSSNSYVKVTAKVTEFLS
jgi:hypothetical protein